MITITKRASNVKGFFLPSSMKTSKMKNFNIVTSDSLNVIARCFRSTMQFQAIIHISLIFFISMKVEFCLGQLDERNNNQYASEVSLIQARVKRWADEKLTDSDQQQSYSIPAANPNFEAAFQGECGKNNNSNPCEHICLDLHDGTYECSCFYGFALAVDGYSCATLDKSLGSGAGSGSTTSASTFFSAATTKNPNEQNKVTQGDTEKPSSFSTSLEKDKVASGSDWAKNERRGFDLNGDNDNNVEPDQDTSHKGELSGSNATVAEIDQTREEELLVKREEDGRADDNRKLLDELASGAELSDNEILGQVGWSENKKLQYKGEGYSEEEEEAKVGGAARVESESWLGKQARQRRLLETRATWNRKKVAEEAAIKNRNGDSGNNITNHTPANKEFYSLQQRHRKRQPGKARKATEKQANTAIATANKQATLATITGTGSSLLATSETATRDNNDGNNSKARQERKWLKYRVDNQNVGQGAESNIKSTSPPTVTEDEEEDIRVDADIKSIMVSNDKLLKRLADLVELASETGEDEQENSSDRSFGLVDKAIEPASGEQLKLEAVNRAKEKEKKKKKKKEHEEEKLDYDLNLLEDLVRKTFEDYVNESVHEETPFGSEQDSTAKLTSYQVNGSLPIPIQLHQSLSLDNGPQNGSRPRRSSHRQTFKTNQIDSLLATTSDTSDGLAQEENDGTAESGLRAVISSPEMGVPSLDLDNRISPNVYNRLCTSEGDNNNNFGSRETFRDCWDLQCESGGRCITETRISSSFGDLARLETRPRCLCPIGRGSYLCQRPVQRNIPSFSGRSYLALPMIKDSSLSNLRLLFRPQSKLASAGRETSLMLYSDKFLLLLDDLSRIELRYIMEDSGGKITRVIGSRDAELNKWNELFITTDASSDESSQLFNSNLIPARIAINRIVLVVPDKIQLNRSAATLSGTFNEKQNKQAPSTELFVAGTPDAFRTRAGAKQQRSPLILDRETLAGFMGCMKELSINKRTYNFKSNLHGDALDGFDIGECCTNE